MSEQLTARLLGFAGLIPFYGFLAGFAFLTDYPEALSQQGFVVYSLAIISFLAGTLWGRARTLAEADSWLVLVVSNGIVVFAVLSLLTAQAMLASALLMLGYLATLWYERRIESERGWYEAMRWQLTLGVVLAHVLYILVHIQKA